MREAIFQDTRAHKSVRNHSNSGNRQLPFCERDSNRKLIIPYLGKLIIPYLVVMALDRTKKEEEDISS